MKKIVKYRVLLIVIVLNILTLFFLFLTNGFISKFSHKIIISSIMFVSQIAAWFMLKKDKVFLYRKIIFLNIVLVFLLALYLSLHHFKIIDNFTSISSFKELILNSKQFGMTVFVIVQFFQVIFLPIPSLIINITGVMIYGPIVGSFLTIIGVVLGSMTSFVLGKIFGFKIVSWLTTDNNAKHYAKLINEKGKFFLIIAFLLPLFPDDLLCLVAGISEMKFKTFLKIVATTRPIGVVFMSFFGGGYIVPFKGWGLYVWPIIAIVVIFSIVIIYKNQEKIEKWILNKIKRKTS